MKSEKKKNIATVLLVVFILGIIPFSLLMQRESVAELQYPIEAKVVGAPSLNVRARATTDSPIVTSIREGGQLLLLREEAGMAINGNMRWYEIEYAGQRGYVSAEYVEFSSWAPDLTPPAADLDFDDYLDSQGFPISYRQALQNLHAKYPKWKFTALKIPVSFETAINSQEQPGVSLLPATMSDAFKSRASYAFDHYNNKWLEVEFGWVNASREAIAFALDPRNYLNEQRIFALESQSYNPEMQTMEGIRTSLSSTYMNRDLDRYSEYFYSAAVESKVSPYHLISRVVQEVGAQGSAAVSGTVSGYEGYYNFYNIGAYGSQSNPMLNGLAYAKYGTGNYYRDADYLLPWSSERNAIIGGAKFLGRDYINNLQPTGYLQKFDLLHDLRNLHQYMANVFAPASEAESTYQSYVNQGNLAVEKEFLIPVFANMPDNKAPYPGEDFQGTPNNWLRAIYIDNMLLPGFSSTNYKYVHDLDAPNNVIRISAVAYGTDAQVEGAGTYKLQPGANLINLKVTAGNGDQRFYELVVNYKSTSQLEVDRVQSQVLQVQPNGFIYGLSSDRDRVENVLPLFKAPAGSELVIADSQLEYKSQGPIATGDRLLQIAEGKVVGTYRFIKFGDVNGDGDVDIIDVDSLMRYISGYLDLNDCQIAAANVLQDEEVDILDVDQLMRGISQYVEIKQNLEYELASE